MMAEHKKNTLPAQQDLSETSPQNKNEANIPPQDEDLETPVFNFNHAQVMEHAEKLAKTSYAEAAYYLQRVASIYEDSLKNIETENGKQALHSAGRGASRPRLEAILQNSGFLAFIERKSKRFSELHRTQRLVNATAYKVFDDTENFLGVVVNGSLLWLGTLDDLGCILSHIYYEQKIAKNQEDLAEIGKRAFLPQYFRKASLLSAIKDAHNHRLTVDKISTKDIILRYLKQSSF